MRDFFFYTKNPFHQEECYQIIKNEIKEVVLNGDDCIFLNAKWRAYLWLYNDKLENDVYSSEDELEEVKSIIPIDDPYVNFFEAYRSVEVKKFLKVLLPTFPELFVKADDEDAYYTAQEYIDTEFDY